MTADRQYLTVAFAEGGRRYTYHHDGEPLEPGDKVDVSSVTGGMVTLTVLDIVEPPPFQTKPVLGKHVPPEDEQPAEPA